MWLVILNLMKTVQEHFLSIRLVLFSSKAFIFLKRKTAFIQLINFREIEVFVYQAIKLNSLYPCTTSILFCSMSSVISFMHCEFYEKAPSLVEVEAYV